MNRTDTPRTDLAPLVAALAPRVTVTATGWGHLAHPDPRVEANCDRLPADLVRLHVATAGDLDALHAILQPLSFIPAPDPVPWWRGLLCSPAFPPPPLVSPVRRVEMHTATGWDGFVTLHGSQIDTATAFVTLRTETHA